MTRDEQILKAGEETASNPFELEGFIEGAEWADKTMLERLRQFIDHHTEIKDVYRFIKYMEEQQ